MRRTLWAEGFRYRINVRALPGAPDLVLRRYNTVVLVHGCFWHGHNCPKGLRRPNTNSEFWNRKLDGNVARDATNLRKVTELGWNAFVVWECELESGTEALLSHLKRLRNVGQY